MLKLLKENLSAGEVASFLGGYSISTLSRSAELPCHHVHERGCEQYDFERIERGHHDCI